MKDGFQQALSLGADQVRAGEYHVGPAKALHRRWSRTTFALVAVILILVAAAMSLAFAGRRSVVGSPVKAQVASPPRVRYPVEIAAFVVPNSATENRRQDPFPALSPVAFAQVRGVTSERRARQTWVLDKRPAAGDSSRSSLVREPLPAKKPVDGASGAVEPFAVAHSADISLAQKEDCPPSFDFDEQGRRHFSSACVATRSASLGASGSVSRPSSACTPSYDLDGQGRKHFKPECFLKAK